MGANQHLGSRCNVVVTGAGPVGAAFALACTRGGVAVALRSRAAQAGPERDGDIRPIALAQASRRILDSIGVWDTIAPGSAPIRCVHVSEQGRLGRVRIEAAQHGLDALGYVTDAASIQRALETALERAPGVRRLTCVQAASLASALEATLSVVADGGGDATPDVGPRRHRDYHQDAVVCNLTTERAHGGVAYERFLPGGPLAMLPLADGRCGLVWTLPAAAARTIACLETPAFVSRVQAAFGHRLGRILDASQRQRFALSLDASRRVVGARTVLIGNAANRLHPVAGQGLNLGLRDAATLAELVSDAWARGEDVGSPQLLERYGALRRADHRRVVTFTDLLARAFTWRPAALGHLRSALMLALQLSPPARSALARRAMGLEPPLPRAARAPWP